MVSVREGGAIAKKQLALRDHLWPGLVPFLWDRKAHKGFTTIPKTMPLILRIMDEMTKGAPVSSTYMTLWCSTWDNGFVQVIKPGEMAFASGFGGQRGEHTWAARMKKLEELQFISLKAGKAGPMTHALIHNPHLILRWHHDNKTPGLMEASFNALVALALDVGAMDLFPAPAPSSPTAAEIFATPLTIPSAPAPPPPAAEAVKVPPADHEAA
jgi:hypothetical protein